MKKTNLFLITMLIFIIVSCDSDPCDDGYTQLDNGVCVPDYVAGIEKSNNLGSIFYHSEYGAITYENDNWYNEDHLIIKNIND